MTPRIHPTALVSPDARIAVISTASSLGPLAGEMYRSWADTERPVRSLSVTVSD